MTNNQNDVPMHQFAFLNLLPPTIRNDIILDSDFCSSNHLISDAIVISINHAIFQRSLLYGAVRKAYIQENLSIQILENDGKEWNLFLEKKEDNFDFVHIKNNEEEHILDYFWPLNPNINTRLECFSKVIKKCNLSSIIEKNWHNILSQEMVSDNDFIKLSEEISRASVSVYEKIKFAMCQSRPMNSSTLVPSSETYYEQLVGKHENSTDIYGYTQFEILKHVNNILLNDNHLALKSILLMSAHSSIIATFNKVHINFEELENIYKWLVNFGDPFSCVAGIEFGLSILHKYPLLDSQIEKLVNKLLDGKIKKDCQLLASLIMLVDGELARLKIFKTKPPFYRRLASITQASLIMRCVIETQINPDILEEWASEQRGMIFYCQSFIDLRLESRWLPDYLIPEQLWAELLGRVYNASQQYGSLINSASLKNILFSNEEGTLQKIIEPISFLPGPLEGNAEPNEAPPEISQLIEMALIEEIPTPASFTALVNSAHYWKIDPHFTELTLKILSNTKHQLSQTENQSQLLFTLNGLARVSSIVKSADLAAALSILARKYRDFLHVNSRPEDLMVIGLISAASFDTLDEWANYIGNWLNELAYLPLDSGAAKKLYTWIKQLCVLEPALYCTAGIALACLDTLNS